MSEKLVDVLKTAGLDVLSCMQCGTCTGSCPSGRHTGLNTRRILRDARKNRTEVLSDDAERTSVLFLRASLRILRVLSPVCRPDGQLPVHVPHCMQESTSSPAVFNISTSFSLIQLHYLVLIQFI